MFCFCNFVAIIENVTNDLSDLYNFFLYWYSNLQKFMSNAKNKQIPYKTEWMIFYSIFIIKFPFWQYLEMEIFSVNVEENSEPWKTLGKNNAGVAIASRKQICWICLPELFQIWAWKIRSAFFDMILSQFHISITRVNIQKCVEATRTLHQIAWWMRWWRNCKIGTIPIIFNILHHVNVYLT